MNNMFEFTPIKSNKEENTSDLSLEKISNTFNFKPIQTKAAEEARIAATSSKIKKPDLSNYIISEPKVKTSSQNIILPKESANPVYNFIDKTLQAAQEGIGKTLERLKIMDFKSSDKSLLKPLINPLEEVVGSATQSFVTAAPETLSDTVKRLQSFSDIQKTGLVSDKYLDVSVPATTADKIGKGIEVAVGAANTAFIPITAIFNAAKEVPGVDIPVKGIEWVFGKAGEAGVFVGDKIINNLPISDSEKESLRPSIEELSGLVGMIVLGGSLFKGVKKGTEITKGKYKDLKYLQTQGLLEEYNQSIRETLGEMKTETLMDDVTTKLQSEVNLVKEKGQEITPEVAKSIVDKVNEEVLLKPTKKYFISEKEVEAINQEELPLKDLYHVTPLKNLESIREKGLTTKGIQQNFEGEARANYFTNDFEVVKGMQKKLKGDTVVLRYKTPGQVFERGGPMMDEIEANSYFYKRDIKPEKLEILTKDGWKPLISQREPIKLPSEQVKPEKGKIVVGEQNPNFPKAIEVLIKDLKPMEYEKFSDIRKPIGFIKEGDITQIERNKGVDEYKRKILAEESIPPAIVLKHVDRTGTWYEVQDGHHKIQAAIELGVTNFPIQIKRTIIEKGFESIAKETKPITQPVKPIKGKITPENISIKKKDAFTVTTEKTLPQEIVKAKEWLNEWTSGKQKNPSQEIISLLDNPKYKSEKDITVYRAVSNKTTPKEWLEKSTNKYSSWAKDKSYADQFGFDNYGDEGYKIISKKVNPKNILVELDKLPEVLKKDVEDLTTSKKYNGLYTEYEGEVIIKPTAKEVKPEKSKQFTDEYGDIIPRKDMPQEIISWMEGWQWTEKGTLSESPPKHIVKFLEEENYKSNKPVTLYRGVISGDGLSKTKYTSWTTNPKVAEMYGEKVIQRIFTPDEILVEFDKMPKKMAEWGTDNSEVVVKPVKEKIEPKKDSIDPLIEEAKKYNSAEEFIKAQTKQEYRSAHQLSLSDSITADKIDIPTLKEAIRTRNGYLNKYNLSDLKKLEKLQNNPDADITIYRASPKNEINEGDWVTTDKIYANDIKKQNGGKVYSYTVKVKDLRFPKDTETLPSLSMASTFSYSPKASQLTDIWNKAQNLKSTQPKIEAEKGTSKIGKSIEAKAIEEKITKGFSEIAEYNKINIKEQAKLATDLINKDIETARKIIRGEETLPQNIRGTSLITAMEEYIKKNPDADLAAELANSPLVSETSIAAQELRLAAERQPDSATAKIQEVKRAREEKMKKRTTKSKSELKKELKKETEKINLSKEDLSWEKFLESIKC